MIEFLQKHPEKLYGPLIEHIQLVLITLAISVAVAAFLTVLSVRFRALGNVLMNIFSVVYSIPSLALFALLIPVSGLGRTTAVIVLTVYNQYLLLRNFITGLNEVDPAIREAAAGIGMTQMQTLIRVQIPLAKKALLRPVDSCNPDPFYAQLEREMLEKINQLGIGPQGFGGRTTAIGVNIETLPTHIAGMPCAVNISCHVTRHESEVI